MTRPRVRPAPTAVVVAALTLILPAAALAQSAVRSSAPDAIVEGAAIITDGPAQVGPATFGTASNTFLTRTAWEAHPIDSTATYNFQNNAGGQGITRTAGSVFFKVPVQLPNGALLTHVEFNYCDTGASTLSTFLFRQVKNAAPVVTTLLSSVGTPGCVVQTANLATPQAIDNNANSYNIELSMASTDGTIAFNSLRVGYRLQASPAPGTATFADVPVGHPFHRFIEALVAAGITGGCGGGNYCPNDAVTRGQMAVFLSVALGLHFPN